jgi:hypothetical protein
MFSEKDAPGAPSSDTISVVVKFSDEAATTAGIVRSEADEAGLAAAEWPPSNQSAAAVRCADFFA